MLPKNERLKERYLFNITYKKKQKVYSGLLDLFYLLKRKNDKFLPKTAFIVSTKVEKKANKRNLIKRRMKSAYIALKVKYPLLNNYSPLIWVSKEKIKFADFSQIKDCMKMILDKLCKSGESFQS